MSFFSKKIDEWLANSKKFNDVAKNVNMLQKQNAELKETVKSLLESFVDITKVTLAYKALVDEMYVMAFSGTLEQDIKLDPSDDADADEMALAIDVKYKKDLN